MVSYEYIHWIFFMIASRRSYVQGLDLSDMGCK